MKVFALARNMMIGILGALLSLFLVAPAAFAVDDDIEPMVSSVIDITDLQLEAIQSMLTDALEKASSGNTVTVVGEYDDGTAESTLVLDIGEGVTVSWQASIRAKGGKALSDNAATYYSVVGVIGSGTFVLEKGGSITATGGNALQFGGNATGKSAAGSRLIVTGGTVISEGKERAILLYSGGITASIGEEEGQTTLIESNYNGATAGGLVVFGAQNIIDITGGTIVSSMSRAVNFATINGGENSTLTVSGGLIKSGSGDESCAIRAGMPGIVIQITSGEILCEGNMAIEIPNATGEASLTIGGDAVVTAGTDAASGNDMQAAAIAVKRKDMGIVIEGNARVQTLSQFADQQTNAAIYSSATGTSVTVKDNASVYAEIPNAIHLSNGTVDLEGGSVFAHGTAIEGAGSVIAGATINQGDGIAIAWDKPADPAPYLPGSFDDLTWLPAGAHVEWTRAALNQAGIRYQSGQNTGQFLYTGAPVKTIELAVEGAEADSRPYDGTLDVATRGTLMNVMPSHPVTLAAAGMIAEKDAGEGKAVTFALEGDLDDLANYTLIQPGTTVDITPALLAIKAEDVKLVAGDPLPTKWNYQVTGYIPGEGIVDAFTAAPVATCAAPDTAQVRTWPITVEPGTTTGNYKVDTINEGTLTVSAAPKPPDPPIPPNPPTPTPTPTPTPIDPVKPIDTGAVAKNLAGTGDAAVPLQAVMLIAGFATIVVCVAGKSRLQGIARITRERFKQ